MVSLNRSQNMKIKNIIHLKIIYFVLLFGMNFPVSAKITTITGSAFGAQHLDIRLKKYTDFITYQDSLLAITNVDKNGNFKILVDLKTPILGIISLGFNRGDIYLEPGKTYSLEILEFDNSQNLQSNTFFIENTLKIKVNGNDSLELNFLMEILNSKINQFVDKKMRKLLTTKNRATLDTLKMELNSSFTAISNEFLQTSLKYKIALLEYVVLPLKRDIVLQKYFDLNPFPYENPDFMEFFKQFFIHYFTTTSSLYQTEIIEAINNRASLKFLIDAVSRDSLMQNEALREFVVLNGIAELLRDDRFKKANLLEILREIIQKSKFPEHKNIARNIIRKYESENFGKYPTNFKLTNNSFEEVTLEDFKGKFIYLMFWSKNCTQCLSDIEYISKLKEQLKDKPIQFVFISLDKSISEMNTIIKAKKFDLTFLHFRNNFQLPEEFDLRSLPSTSLIRPDGKIITNLAPKPDQELLQYLLTFLQ